MFLVWIRRISRRPTVSGIPMSTSLSNRPKRRKAGSMEFGRFVAAMTMTWDLWNASKSCQIFLKRAKVSRIKNDFRSFISRHRKWFSWGIRKIFHRHEKITVIVVYNCVKQLWESKKFDIHVLYLKIWIKINQYFLEVRRTSKILLAI